MTHLELTIMALKAVRGVLNSLRIDTESSDFDMYCFFKNLDKAIAAMECEQKVLKEAERILKGTESLPTSG